MRVGDDLQGRLSSREWKHGGHFKDVTRLNYPKAVAPVWPPDARPKQRVTAVAALKEARRSLSGNVEVGDSEWKTKETHSINIRPSAN